MGLELHIFSLDTFWKPGTMSSKEEGPSWWLSAASLKDVRPPGFDARWDFAVLRAARTAFADKAITSALLTSRPAHKEMRQEVERILHESSLDFDLVALKPVWPPEDTATYKAMQVRRWLVQERRVTKLVLWDRAEICREAISSVAKQMRLPFEVHPAMRSTAVGTSLPSVETAAG